MARAAPAAWRLGAAAAAAACLVSSWWRGRGPRRRARGGLPARAGFLASPRAAPRPAAPPRPAAAAARSRQGRAASRCRLRATGAPSGFTVPVMVAALRSLGFKQIPRTQSRQKFQNFVENLNIPAQVLASALKSASRRAQQKQFYANRKRDEARKKDEACQDRFSLSGYPREVIEAAAKGILGLQRTDILETRKMVEMLEVMGITRRDIDEFMREVCGQEFDDWSERPPRGSAGPRGRGRAESQGSGRVASQGRGRAASQGRGSTRRQPRSWEAEDAEDVEDMLSGGRSRRSRRQGPPFQGGRRVYADSDDFHRFHLGGEAAGGPWDEDFERRSREAHAAGLDVEDLEEFERHFGEGAFSAPWVSHGYGGPGGGGEPFGSGAPAGREPDTEERVEAAMAEALARGWRPQELSRGQASRLLGVAAWGASAGELREARRRLVLRWHPDRNEEKESASAALQLILASLELLRA